MKEFMEERGVLLKELNSNATTGLKEEQVAENAEKYGLNSLTREKPESLLTRIWKSATEPMLIMLIIAGVIATVVNIVRAFTGGEADFLECIGIFIAICLSVFITVIMEGKSAKAFETLSKINDDIMVKVLRSGNTIIINQRELVVGDVLILATGDKVPADGRLLESVGLATDESALTGESVPASKNSEFIICDEKTPVADRINMLYSGTYITNGFGKMVVTAVGDHTEFGKIARELTTVNDSETPLQEKLGRLGKIIAIFGVIAASIVFIAQIISFAMNGGITLESVIEAFVTSIILIVATVPEGLPTTMAVSLSINTIKLSKKNALVKKMIASETVGCINVICSDKTGTLTENKMTVNGSVSDEMTLRNICINSSAEIGVENEFIGNPTECAMLIAAKKSGWNYKEIRENADLIHVFPFSSEEKNMTSIIKEKDDSFIAFTKGSPEKILALSNISKSQQSEFEKQIKEYQEKAFRIIAFAHREFDTCPELNKEFVEKDMIFDGFLAISDPLREDVREAVNNCQIAGIDLKILTGDNIVTATAIANELKILDENHIAVEARTIDEMSDDELAKMLEKIVVIARSTPGVKMRVVNLLKSKGNVVAVTGDGINDAPALKNADVGIAMGISGTEVSKEASDIVLLDDSFATIVNAIKWGRGIYENFKRFISFQLTVNVSSVIVVLTSILIGLKAPFTALQLLWINIIMDGPLALTLGLEPIYQDLMNQKPVKRSDNIVSKSMMIQIGVTGLYISGVFLYQYCFNFLGVDTEQMSTVLFAMFSLFQLFNSFNCRELHETSIFKNLLKNKLMLGTIVVTFVLQVVIIQYASGFFGTVPLSITVWAKIFAVASSVVVLSELVKLVKFVTKRKTN